MAIRSQSYGSSNRAVDYTKSSPGECWSERLTGSQGGTRTNCVRQLSGWIAEVCDVEDVEHLGPELDVGRFLDHKLLGYDQILLDEFRPMKLVAHKIAKSTGLWNCKSSGIKDRSIFVD